MGYFIAMIAFLGILFAAAVVITVLGYRSALGAIEESNG